MNNLKSSLKRLIVESQQQHCVVMHSDHARAWCSVLVSSLFPGLFSEGKKTQCINRQIEKKKTFPK